MPKAQAIPEQLRPEIERRILVEKQMLTDVPHWLAGRGYICQEKTLRRRYQEWGISRRGLGNDPVMVEYINKQFHTTLNDDETIASHLSASGYSVTASTVARVRLAKGWRH